MAIIPDDDQQYLRDLFSEQLSDPVTLRFYTERASKLTIPGRRQCETCEDTRELLDELVALSDKLTLDVHERDAGDAAVGPDGLNEIPTTVLSGATKGAVRFVGVPAGYEFATMIEDLVDVSRGTTGLQPTTKKALEGLTKPVHIKVFVTPT